MACTIGRPRSAIGSAYFHEEARAYRSAPSDSPKWKEQIDKSSETPVESLMDNSSTLLSDLIAAE